MSHEEPGISLSLGGLTQAPDFSPLRNICGQDHSAFHPVQFSGIGSPEVFESSSARLSKLGRFSIMV
ncbi:MAG: hypothetical protein VXY82_02720, partial [Planctomycetota bacterium]|nr:hypothetical protein [Planctomycetota bacterium]